MSKNIATAIFEKLTGEKELLELIDQSSNIDTYGIIDDLFQKLSINLKILEKDLKNIPKNNQFIAIANHPFGALDELIMLKLFSNACENFTLLSIFTHKLLNDRSNLIYSNSSKFLTEDLLNEIEEQIRSGKCVGLFPAIETSSFHPLSMSISDSKWKNSIIKLIKDAYKPILPLYIQGNNSLIFYLTSLLNKNLLKEPIAGEILNKKNIDLTVRIGSPIKPDEISDYQNTNDLGRYLRSKLYSLGSGIEVKKFFKPIIKPIKEPEQIAQAVSNELILKEIDSINDNICYSQQNYDIYVATANQIPNILNEIGRLRELTFRKIGEGTNKSRDLDEYDLYYHHLFLWDRDEKKIIGAYRLGKGRDIFDKFGRKGFYTKSLFRYNKEFNKILKQTIELGRSFIVPEYQNKRLPLFMLWKGIMYFILINEDHRYLLGPVSISNYYTSASKSLIVSFIKKYHFNNELSKYVKPKKKFKFKIKNVDEETILKNTNSDIFKMDKIISEIEPSNYTIPVLLKRYIKQNAKIIGFNIDPKFNNALDGLMILDLKDAPEETIETMKKDLNIK